MAGLALLVGETGGGPVMICVGAVGGGGCAAAENAELPVVVGATEGELAVPPLFQETPSLEDEFFFFRWTQLINTMMAANPVTQPTTTPDMTLLSNSVSEREKLCSVSGFGPPLVTVMTIIVELFVALFCCFLFFFFVQEIRVQVNYILDGFRLKV